MNKKLYTSLTIKGFRLFNHLKLNRLGRINLLLGCNKSGKTSLLEALYLHACGPNLPLFLQEMGLQRQAVRPTSSLEVEDRIISLFQGTDTQPFTIFLSAEMERETSPYTLAVEFYPGHVLSSITRKTVPEVTDALGHWDINLSGKLYQFDQFFPLQASPHTPVFKTACFHDACSYKQGNRGLQIFSHLKRENLLDDFTNKMRRFFPDLEGFDSIPYADGSAGPVFVCRLGQKQLPLYVMGDGFRRWFSLIGSMATHPHALQCIDEADATFHPTYHGALARHLLEFAESFNNQVFLTTHSQEFVDKFFVSLYGPEGCLDAQVPDPVQVITLVPGGTRGNLDTWSLSGREAWEQREKYGLELRG
jgi:hypothetical protein